MSPKKTYTAIYERDSEADAWNVRIEGLEGCQTYGRSLRQAQARIREALALWLDRDPASLTVHDQLPKDLAEVASRANQARSEAERAGAKAQEQAARAVRGAHSNAASADETPPSCSASPISASSNSSKRADTDLPIGRPHPAICGRGRRPEDSDFVDWSVLAGGLLLGRTGSSVGRVVPGSPHECTGRRNTHRDDRLPCCGAGHGGPRHSLTVRRRRFGRRQSCRSRACRHGAASPRTRAQCIAVDPAIWGSFRRLICAGAPQCRASA